ncbi:Uncharacterized protein PECH_005400 [Penicillium ucsense]|uniref:Uncharacterized protein n=1 Tax=Penicillium ucsense TaxID=2839758 RepID=A0A8J8W2P1_9EURO|nr:Uncharacterized protein PECM_005938 [Penicillium ucsense]KAF7736302.1 Uncharacterized protein PECH_005400 [Penicillium ucsense]
MPKRKSSSKGDDDVRAAQVLDTVHDELKKIRAAHERLTFGFPHTIRTLGVINGRELNELAIIADRVAQSADDLREKLEANDPAKDYYEARKKLWDVRQASQQVALTYRQQASAFSEGLDAMRQLIWGSLSMVTDLLNDASLKPLEELQQQSVRTVKRKFCNPQNVSAKDIESTMTEHVRASVESEPPEVIPPAFVQSDPYDYMDINADLGDDPLLAEYNQKVEQDKVHEL